MSSESSESVTEDSIEKLRDAPAPGYNKPIIILIFAVLTFLTAPSALKDFVWEDYLYYMYSINGWPNRIKNYYNQPSLLSGAVEGYAISDDPFKLAKLAMMAELFLLPEIEGATDPEDYISICLETCDAYNNHYLIHQNDYPHDIEDNEIIIEEMRTTLIAGSVRIGENRPFCKCMYHKGEKLQKWAVPLMYTERENSVLFEVINPFDLTVRSTYYQYLIGVAAGLFIHGTIKDQFGIKLVSLVGSFFLCAGYTFMVLNTWLPEISTHDWSAMVAIGVATPASLFIFPEIVNMGTFSLSIFGTNILTILHQIVGSLVPLIAWQTSLFVVSTYRQIVQDEKLPMDEIIGATEDFTSFMNDKWFFLSSVIMGGVALILSIFVPSYIDPPNPHESVKNAGRIMKKNVGKFSLIVSILALLFIHQSIGIVLHVAEKEQRYYALNLSVSSFFEVMLPLIIGNVLIGYKNTPTGPIVEQLFLLISCLVISSFYWNKYNDYQIESRWTTEYMLLIRILTTLNTVHFTQLCINKRYRGRVLAFMLSIGNAYDIFRYLSVRSLGSALEYSRPIESFIVNTIGLAICIVLVVGNFIRIKVKRSKSRYTELEDIMEEQELGVVE